MGYDLKRFVDQLSVPNHLRCLICNLVLEDPLQSPCEHSFCNQCITIYLNQSTNHCPHYEEDSVSVKSDKKKSPLRKMSFRKIIGKSPKENKLPILKLSDLKALPESVLEELNSLKVYCDFNSNGCKEELNLVNLKEHVKHCKFIDTKSEEKEEESKPAVDSEMGKKKDKETVENVETRVDSTEIKRKNSENKSVDGEEVGSDDFVVIPNTIKASSSSTKSTESVQTTSSKENVNKDEPQENVEKKKKKKKKKAKNQDGDTGSLKQDSGQSSEVSSKAQSKESLVSTGLETEEVKRALKSAEEKTENLRSVNMQLLGQITEYRTQIQKLKEEHNLQSKLGTGEVDELKSKIQNLEKDNKSQALRIIQLLDSNEQMNKFIMDLKEEQQEIKNRYNSTLSDVQKTLSFVKNCKQVS